MRKTLLILSVLGDALLWGTIGNAAPGLTVYGNAPIGHLQPRAQQYSPTSPASQAVDRQLSTYDVRQQRLDGQLDKQLNICRGC
jgi:hypothetical protein